MPTTKATMPRPLDDRKPKTLREKWGKNLRDIRLKRYKTRTDFYEAMRLSDKPLTLAALAHYETGRRFPDVETIYEMAKVLRVSPAKLMPPHIG